MRRHREGGEESTLSAEMRAQGWEKGQRGGRAKGGAVLQKHREQQWQRKEMRVQ